MRRFSHLSIALIFALAPAASSAAQNPPQGRSVAVIDFAYLDTSGESRDQSAEHQARLQAFMAALRSDLVRDGSGVFRVVTPRCGSEPCTIKTPAETLLAAARDAGADIVLVGGVQKMSTLVQWAEVESLDAKSGRSLGKKLFTFRGDNDEAWRRAEKFIFDEVLPQP